MAAWCEPPKTIPPVRLKRKPKSHLRNLATDLQMIARDTAKKEA